MTGLYTMRITNRFSSGNTGLCKKKQIQIDIEDKKWYEQESTNVYKVQLSFDVN